MKTFIKIQLRELFTSINDNFVTICAFITFSAPVAFFIACIIIGYQFIPQ